jgi:hypothetical protein
MAVAQWTSGPWKYLVLRNTSDSFSLHYQQLPNPLQQLGTALNY